MGWTQDQEKAIQRCGHNIIVSAGAGSGKTAVLSERVLEFVKKGYKIEEFLILTFTNLAAGEMKERIRSKLEKASSEEANYVDSSDISTFDSFASSIVKKYHFLLGLSPNLTNVDSNVISVYKRNIVDDIFDRYYKEKNEKFEKMIDDLCFKNDDELRKLILKIHALAELEIDKKSFLDNFVSTFYSEKFQVKFVDKIENILFECKERLRNSLYDLPFVPRTKTSRVSYLEEALELATPLISACYYNDMFSALSNFKLPPSPRNVDEDLSSIAISREILSEIKEKTLSKLPATKEEIFALFDKQKDYAEILIDITKELDERQWKYKMEKQVFEFNDIAKFALNVVKDNKDIQEELKNKYKMIMIDEYQDTSLLQEEFVKLISSNNVYMVGDIKQSIYAFRNARSDIFKDKYDRYKVSKVDEAIDMKKNFRSRKEVLADINTIFSIIMSDEIGGANYKKDHMIDFGNQDYLIGKSDNQNYSSTFITYDIEGNAQEKREYEIRIIAEDIISKINNHYQVFVPGDKDKGILPSTRDATFKDFCILMDRGKLFETYKKVFTEYKIPLYVENDENIKDQIIVKILNNILILIKAIREEDYSSQDFLVSFLSLNRSFIYEKSDEELYLMIKNKKFQESELIITIKKILEENADLSSYLLLEQIIDQLKIYQKLVLLGDVKKNQIYLDEFLKYFKQMSDLDYSIDDFITYFKYIEDYDLKITLSSTGSSLDSVKIMNIHKSKGLEFPIVYYSGLNAEFVKVEQKQKYTVSNKFGLVLTEDERNPIKFLNNHFMNLETLSEKIRLLYVSLTRSREKMIFILEESKKTKELSKVNSFGEILFPIHHNFNHYLYEEKEDKEELNIKESKIEHQKFEMVDIKFDLERNERTKVSKEMKIGVNKDILELGTKLHELLEIIDFKNPDYSFITNEFYKSKVKKLLESDLLKNVKDGKVFKEYEYFDEEHHGIIDLLIVYSDHIDIIDYKTKNIKDDEYDKQVRIYRDYINKISNLPVNLYLYSIIDSAYIKIK